MKVFKNLDSDWLDSELDDLKQTAELMKSLNGRHGGQEKYESFLLLNSLLVKRVKSIAQMVEGIEYYEHHEDKNPVNVKLGRSE